MRVGLAILLICAVCAGCTHLERERAAASPATRPASFPTIGEPVSRTSAQFLPGYMIIATHVQAYRTYTMTWSEHELSLGVDDDGVIRYIAVSDPDFITPEGFQVGMRYRDLKACGGEALHAGYCYYVKLPSGWNAAFKMKLTKLPFPQEPIAWFFKGPTTSE